MLSFLSPNKVIKTFGDQEVAFYPTRSKMAPILAQFISPLADALAILMIPNQTDIKRVEQQSIDKKNDNFDTTTVNEPISVELAKYRDTSRSKALKDLIEGLARPSSLKTIAMLLVDSMRDEFETSIKGPKNEDVDNLIDNSDIETIIVMAKALLEANEKAAGPLAPKFKDLANQVEQKTKTNSVTETPLTG